MPSWTAKSPPSMRTRPFHSAGLRRCISAKWALISPLRSSAKRQGRGTKATSRRSIGSTENASTDRLSVGMRGPFWSSGGQRTTPAAGKSKPLDEACLDQGAVEAPRLGAIGAAVEQPGTALQDPLLLGERGIKRHAGGLLHDQRQIGRVKQVERRAKRRRREVDGIDRIVGREIARIEPQQAFAKL